VIRVSRAQREIVGDPAFIDRVVFHFKRYRIEYVHHLADHVLRRRIVHGIAKGRSYGLTWEYSLTVFVAHMFGINPEFDKHPAVHRGLNDASLAPDLRIDALIAGVTDDEWEEAARQSDPVAYWKRIDAAAPSGED
jgi:hypothetical protein